MTNDNDTQATERPIGGGFGAQVTSGGRPRVIDSIKRIPVSFEEFMRDESVVEIVGTSYGEGVSQ